MSKHRQQNKPHQKNRVGTSVSVDPEMPNEYQQQAYSARSSGYIPSYEDVQRRAYQIHEEKGGSELENWLEAERELKEEHQEQN